MVVALGLPLNGASIILGSIFSTLFSEFGARGPISILTPPTVALTEFFYADAVASVHLLSESWYRISSIYVYLRSWMHIMSMLWSVTDAVSSGRWPISFKVLTLNFAICIVRLHFSIFCLSSVADFSNTEARAPNSAGRAPFFFYRSWQLNRRICSPRTGLWIALRCQRVYPLAFYVNRVASHGFRKKILLLLSAVFHYYMIWFGWVLWHINHCRLFNAKSSLYINIRYIWFGLVGFYGISTIVGYLMPNPLYTYILNIYDLVWLAFMAYQPLWII